MTDGAVGSARAALAAALTALALCAVAAGALAVGGPIAAAQARPQFGIGDQSPATFTDPRFAWLGIRKARVVVPYDVMRQRGERAALRTWLLTAQTRHVQPFVVFSHSLQRPRLLPSVTDYRNSVLAFLHAFPWVHDLGTWDEENHVSQPTAGDPAQAARYYEALRGICHGCALVAADVLDEAGMADWVHRFRAAAPNARLWGLHNYFDLNRGGTVRTRLFLSLVPGEVWFTETGGVVWRYNGPTHHFIVRGEVYAERAAQRLASLAGVSSRIERVYYYHWRTGTTLTQARRRPGHVTWDSGLVRPDCGARPALLVIAAYLGRSPRRVPTVVRDRYGNCSTPPRRRRASA